MEVEEIKEFLREKNGYLKEGGKRLRYYLNKRGFNTLIPDPIKTTLGSKPELIGSGSSSLYPNSK